MSSLKLQPKRQQGWANTFHSLHPSHKGSYSVERLQALKHYCDQASLFRVVCVLVILPTPALLVAIGLELIPLQDPAEGWKANIGAWVRLGLVGVSVSTGLIVQTNEMVPASKLSKPTTVLVAVVASAFYLLITCGVASTWVYPIPFGYILFAPVFSTLLVSTFLVAIGPTKFRKNPALGLHLRKQLGIIMIQTSMCCIYPAFSALYLKLEPLQQTALVFMLPIIKIIIQSAVVRFSSHVQEYIPGITVFSVEVFNALYLTKCMQSAKSVMTYVAIMLFDVLEMVLAFYDMKEQIARVHQVQNQYDSNSESNLLNAVLAVCNEPAVLEGSTINIRSSLKLRIFKASLSPRARSKVTTTTPCNILSSDQNIMDTPTSLLQKPSSTTKSVAGLATKRKFVNHSLKVLFQCEYHVLVEYVESVIPMVYSLYVAILCELPSAKYYPETRGMTPKHVVSMALNVMLYAWMEVLSLVALHFVVKRKFGFSPMYVLAFVLENQAIELQARLTVWFAYVLQLTLVHFGKRFSRCRAPKWLGFDSNEHNSCVGVDFTLKFAWITNH